MQVNSDRKAFFRARHAVLLWAVAGIVSVAQFAPAASASGAKDPAALPENPGAPRTSIFRSGVLETKEGLTLRLVADLGSVNITPIEAGSPPVVRYTVHVETDAHGREATQLLDRKSTRLNSSHRTISYAVSCLK